MPRRFSPRRRLATYASILFLGVMSRLSLQTCRRIGRLLGLSAYHILPRLRRVGLKNLELAFGETLSGSEKKRVLREAAINMGTVAAEFAHLPTIAREVREGRIRIEGFENIDRSRGALLVGAHFGNWEWMAGSASALGLRTAEIIRPLDDPQLDRIIDQVRRASGTHTVSKDAAGPEIRRLLREGVLVGVLADQSPRENAVPVTFFGQPCWATIAPALIALRTKAPVHLVTMLRADDATYTLRFYPPLEFNRSGDFTRDIISITQKCQDALETLIREHPGQWLWFHRRWKDRPRLAQEWAQRQARSKS